MTEQAKQPIISDPELVAAYDQISAFFDPRIKLTITALAGALQEGLAAEDCFVLATRTLHNFTDDAPTLAALAALLVVRIAEEENRRGHQA
jgi:hypothetical protein